MTGLGAVASFRLGGFKPNNPNWNMNAALNIRTRANINTDEHVLTRGCDHVECKFNYSARSLALI